MKAKDMFEKLGYSWKETQCYIEYTKYHYKHWIFRSKQIITFYKSIKYMDIFDENLVSINMDLLQAINQQMKEIGVEE